MSKFNVKINRRNAPNAHNLAGGNAYSMNAEEELTHAVLTSFLNETFYENSDARLARIISLCSKVTPEFLARLAVVARKEFHLRTLPVVLVAELSKKVKGSYNLVAFDGFYKGLVARTVEAVINRPDELTELVSYFKKNGVSLPKQVRRGIRHALLKFNRYQLAKYKSSNKDVKLVDVLNLVHPNPKNANKEQQKAWKDLVNDKLVSEDTWEAEISKDASASTWESLLLENKIGYMALLRNLNNLDRYKVSKVALNKAIEKLTDREEIRRSKQLPFRFFTAYANINNRLLLDAVSEAMDIAVDNVPTFDGDTLIAVDASGSMQGDAIRKAAVFASALIKANRSADTILYDTSARSFAVSSRLPVVDLVNKIVDLARGGGTKTSVVFEYAMYMRKRYKRIIILSDNESWSELSVVEAYNGYKKALNTDPFVYAIDIQGYGTTDLKASKNVYHFTGWSERLFDFMAVAEKGVKLTDYIKSYEL